MRKLSTTLILLGGLAIGLGGQPASADHRRDDARAQRYERREERRDERREPPRYQQPPQYEQRYEQRDRRGPQQNFAPQYARPNDFSAGDAARRAQQMNGGGRILSVDPRGPGYRVKVLKEGEVRVFAVPDGGG